MFTKRSSSESLRQSAERVLRNAPLPHASPDDAPEGLLHELQVHAVALEIQNEALSRAQEELEVSHSRFRELFDFAPIAYVSIGTDGRIEAANHAAAELLGVRRDALHGKRLSQFVAEEDAVTFERHRREVLRTTDRLRAEVTLNPARGSQVPEVVLESICTNRVTGEWRVAILDVTEFRALARKVAHADRLQAIGVHVSAIAHDFSNLLSAMLGHADVALERLDAGNPARSAVEKLRHVGERGATAIRHMSAFARKDDEHRRVLDVNEFIRGSESLLKSVLGRKVGLRLLLEAQNAATRIDPAEFEQVLLNLVANADHAMPHGGTLTLETRTLEAKLDEDAAAPEGTVGSFIQLAVSDTGVGMDAATRARATEPFFTTKPAGRGTGLGLALARQVIERAGGRIELESAPRRGTTVKLLLPSAAYSQRTSTRPPPRPVCSPAPIDLPPDLGVIVMEDDPDKRRATCKALAGLGCEAVPASTSVEALGLLEEREGRATVLLADLSLVGPCVTEFENAAVAVNPGLTLVFTRPHFSAAAVDRHVRERAVVLEPEGAGELLARTLAQVRE